jgi:hypothetical protein
MKLIKLLNDLTIGKYQYWFREPVTIYRLNTYTVGLKRSTKCIQCVYNKKPDMELSCYDGYFCKNCGYIKEVYKNRYALKRWRDYENS